LFTTDSLIRTILPLAVRTRRSRETLQVAQSDK
jgi:hypothetical protein